MHYPLLPPPPARRRIPRQFSISAMFALTAFVAVGVALFKKDGFGVLMFEDGGLFVLIGMVAAMLALVGIAFGLAKLSAPAAAVVCVATLVGLALVAITAAAHWDEIREVIHRVLGQTNNPHKRIELAVFWAGVLGISIAFGSILGYGIAQSRERN